MRNFLTTVALAATLMIASNAMAQTQQQRVEEFWWPKDLPMLGTGDYNFGKLGFDGGTFSFKQFGDKGAQNVDRLYVSEQSTKVVNEGGTLEVGELLVTPESIDALKNFENIGTNTATTVTNFTLYVGTPETITDSLGFFGTKGTFGYQTTDTPITMSKDAINGVGKAFGANSAWNVTGDLKVLNEGTIGQLTYSGGIYDGADGRIDNLFVGTDITNYDAAYWGTVDKLGFVKNDKDGGKVTSYADFDDATGKLIGAVNSITASAVALVNGIVNLDMTSISKFANGSGSFLSWIDTLTSSDSQFSIDFGVLLAGLGEVDASGFDYEGFKFYWSETDQFSLAALLANDFEGTWVENGAGAIYEAPTVDVALPEPATLAVLGLGLAGLGMVSRRRRK